MKTQHHSKMIFFEFYERVREREILSEISSNKIVYDFRISISHIFKLYDISEKFSWDFHLLFTIFVRFQISPVWLFFRVMINQSENLFSHGKLYSWKRWLMTLKCKKRFFSCFSTLISGNNLSMTWDLTEKYKPWQATWSGVEREFEYLNTHRKSSIFVIRYILNELWATTWRWKYAWVDKYC